jgi:hypothetical protein
MKMRTGIAAGAVTAGLLFGAVSMAGGANASSPTLQTVTKVETLVSPKCFHYTQTTTTYYHWSKTHYVLYAGPKKTVTTGTTCHA